MSIPLRIVLVLFFASAVGSVWLVKAEPEQSPVGWYRVEVVHEGERHSTLHLCLGPDGRAAVFFRPPSDPDSVDPLRWRGRTAAHATIIDIVDVDPHGRIFYSLDWHEGSLAGFPDPIIEQISERTTAGGVVIGERVLRGLRVDEPAVRGRPSWASAAVDARTAPWWTRVP